ncbi:hypothetical protein EUX98_g5369 [Antrodiella citrinella]|uniref:Uncharacterized protein n=1 Tax=Antrodiella citrinella TaxID=2447956 RepID=A0A4S4MU24_9APHY|nr:hypothetical protein EUX98_g5369 [Antrodiella citrinella]
MIDTFFPFGVPQVYNANGFADGLVANDIHRDPNDPRGRSAPRSPLTTAPSRPTALALIFLLFTLLS